MAFQLQFDNLMFLKLGVAREMRHVFKAKKYEIPSTEIFVPNATPSLLRI